MGFSLVGIEELAALGTNPAEIETLQRDRAEGTVAIARRLQHLDAINARVSESGDSDNGTPVLRWILIGAVIVVGAVGFALARRASKRRDQAPPPGNPPAESS